MQVRVTIRSMLASPPTALPLAVEYANTLSASRGRTSDHLENWLAGRGTAPDPRFAPLRDAIRALIAAAAEQAPYPAESLAALNAASAVAPQWLELTDEGVAVVHAAATASDADRLLADV